MPTTPEANPKVVSLTEYRAKHPHHPSIHASIEAGELKFAAEDITADDVRPLLLAIFSLAVDLVLKLDSTAVRDISDGML